jgi:hypothetical protein
MTKDQFEEIIIQEGDFHEFTHLGFKCSIVRHSTIKALCGYIYLTKDSKHFEVNYEYIHVPIYGGWTFSEFDESKNYWVVGFDCLHLNDITKFTFEFPAFGNRVRVHRSRKSYKNLDFVKAELQRACESFYKNSHSYERNEKIDKVLN